MSNQRFRNFSWAVTLSLSVVGLCPGEAADNALTYLGSTLWTRAQDVEVRDGLVYVACLNGLQIFDIADSKSPDALSQVYLGGGYAVALAGNTALVAAADKGLAVIDVTDPNNPALKSVIDTPGEARDVVLEGSIAYVADGSGGVSAVDFADPAAPRVLGSWDSPGEALGLKLREKMIYLADGSAGLRIVDAALPSALVPKGVLDTDGTAESVALSGSFAYIADGAGGIKVVNVSAPDAPKLSATLVATGYARSIATEGTLLCVGSLYDGGYQLLDISDPAAPAVISSNKYTMYNEGWNIALFGNRGVIVDYFSGVFIFDFADPKKPKNIGQIFTPSTIVAACGRDSLAFAVGELSGAQAVDVADPSKPVFLGRSSIFRGVQNIAVNGRYVYVTDRWSIKVFDAADPAALKPGKPLAFTEGIPRTLAVRGNAAYLTADNFGFYTLDVTDPAAPKIVGSFKLSGFTYGLDAAGDFAYLANSDTGLHILDLQKPDAPAEIAVIKLPGEPSGVAVRGHLAFAACGSEGLVVVDIGKPDEPKILGTILSDDFSSAVVLDGDFAYVADGLAGVKKIDLSDPAAPRIVASYDTPGEAQNLFVLGETVLVGDTYSLIVLKK